MSQQQVVTVYVDIKRESMDDAIDWAQRFEGVTKVSLSIRSFGRQLKVKGEGIDGPALTRFLESRVGYAKLMKVKKAGNTEKIFRIVKDLISKTIDENSATTDTADTDTKSRTKSPEHELL